jgi:hypothetical protein
VRTKAAIYGWETKLIENRNEKRSREQTSAVANIEKDREVQIMAYNFRILLHRNSESAHLKLMGNFDGTSAHQLLDTMKTCSGNANKVFIHTDGLKDVKPFGMAVFQSNFSQIGPPPGGFIFTGEKLMPENR